MPSIAGIDFDVIVTEGPTPLPRPVVAREDGVGGSIAVVLPDRPATWQLRCYVRRDGVGGVGLEAHVGTEVNLVFPVYTGTVFLVDAVEVSKRGVIYDGAAKTLLEVVATVELWP